MTEYILFAGHNYYPGGGMNDYRGTFSTVKEAVDKGTERDDWSRRYDWYQVIDKNTLEIVVDR